MPCHPPRGTRCLSASLVFIPSQPSPSSPRAAAQRDKIKAIPAPGDLLPGNNWVLFRGNIEHPSPNDGKSTGEQGLGGMGVWGLSWGSMGIKTGFMKRHLSNNNATDQGEAPEQFLYILVP